MLWWKIAAFTSSAGFLVTVVVLFGSGLFHHVFGVHGFDSAAVLTQVKQLNELVAVKYSIQRVVGLREPKVPFGEESILLMVQGEVLGGVDLTRLTPRDITFSGDRTARITLPTARILHAFLDEKETKVWDREITWWTPWVSPDPDLEHKARVEAINDITAAALGMGILDQAQKNAQTAIQEALASLQLRTEFKTQTLD